MNEQRTEAYLNLINQLLTCNQGDEPRILQENQELLDQGLIEVMVAVAQQLGEAGNENTAQWLMNMARQLAEALGLLDNTTTESANTPQDYFNFLIETLQKVAENDNPQVIYSFWAQNLDKLDDNFRQILGQILDSWARNALVSAKTEEATYVAGVIGDFSSLIQQFPLGNIAINKEIAITGHKIALNIADFDIFSLQWAMARYNLANAYRERIRGDKAENLENAIKLYQEALKGYTFNTFPQYWADTQHNLATAYSERIRGDKAENLEKAITGFTEAFKVYTFDAFPQQWVAMQNNLAITQNDLACAYLTSYLTGVRGEQAENLERVITLYKEALKVLTFDAFPKKWAEIQHYLGIAYKNRIRGDKANNLERAISCCENALQVYTFETFPQEWALVQNTLAGNYGKRIKGKKADNLEKGVTYYENVLKVCTREAFPEIWAFTQTHLAYAYSNRIKGDKADNLERAISCCENALQVYTCEAFPELWADTQNSLGIAYRNRIKEDKADNLERAIACYKNALQIYTREDLPQLWAQSQINLGNAYSDRIKGDKADNLEMAIAYYYNDLEVTTRENYPYEWAQNQNCLATVYKNRIKGDKADNLEMAIACYENALEVYTNQTFSYEWAQSQNNLGNAYLFRIKEDEAENLEKAISYYKNSLQVFTCEAFPENWANTQNNLASAYSKRMKGDKADNLEMAITCCENSLQVYTCEAFPYKWARSQCSLANAYSERKKGDKTDNLEKAITSYHNALTIWTHQTLPLECFAAALNLANLHYDEKQWQPATEAYHIAIEAVENSRLEALNPQSRQEVLSNAIDVFHRIVQAHLKLNQPEKALEYIERSKGRNLVELMTQKNLQPQGVSQEIIDQLNELKQRVVKEQIRLQSQSMNQNLMRSDKLTPDVQDQSYLKEYQQELDNFIEREIKTIDPIFSLTQKVEPIPFTDIQALTDAETCLLQWYLTGEKILAFVVSLDGDVKYWESEETGLQSFNEIFDNYLKLYNHYRQNKSNQWKEKLPDFLEAFADTLQINHLLTLIPNTCKRLIIIPHWFLHILPLHALPVSNSHFLKRGCEGAKLHDLFPNGVQYAPSCQLLKIAQSFHHTEFNKLFAIQNPTKDLLFTDLEVNILSIFFTESQIIAKDNATQNTILFHLKSSDNHCHHFSCHGGFNPANPLESALFLANQESLTLGEIFELRFNQCRLVTLSACETGLIDLKSISDEYIGLPSGFLFAGSPSVISSLWTVNRHLQKLESLV
jgi:CHAT domain-containing protein